MEKFLAKKQGRIDAAVALLDSDLKKAVADFDKANSKAHEGFAATIKAIDDEFLALVEAGNGKSKP